MGFDIKGFAKATYEDRVEEVPVPDLAEYFTEGEAAVFKVRALTGAELAHVHEAVATYKNMDAIAAALVNQAQEGLDDKINALREVIGLGDKVPDEIVRRLELLITGCVEPVFDRPAAVKFAENHCIEFYNVTNKITTLTGQGRLPLGKSKPSGAMTE